MTTLCRAVTSANAAGRVTTSTSAPENQEKKQGLFEETGKKMDQGIQKTGEKIDQGLNKAGEGIQKGLNQAGEKVKDATQ
jgi:hypothetical protein